MLRTVLASVIVVGLSACQSSSHVYNEHGECITCINNPFNGEPINHDEGTSEERMAKVDARQSPDESSDYVNHVANAPVSEHFVIEETLAIDVDIAYARLKRELDLKSFDDIAQSEGDWAARLRSKDASYSHVKTPGVIYELKDSTLPDDHRFMAFYEIVIQKASATTSQLHMEVVIRGNGRDGTSFITDALDNAYGSSKGQWRKVAVK